MPSTFVWFHNHSEKPSDSTQFYTELLGWRPAAGPPGMTMLAADAEPFAGLGGLDGVPAWVPFVEVDDVDGAVRRATRLASLIQMLPARRRRAGQLETVGIELLVDHDCARAVAGS